jgi:CRISPR-associated protein Csx17
MADVSRHDLALPGCTPEPLMAYLKALGVLRLLSEQKDRDVRGWWKNDVFWLRSSVLFEDTTTDDGKRAAREALKQFFLFHYEPTPIIAPWGGRSGFFAGPTEKTAREALEKIAISDLSRLQRFQRVISFVRQLLKDNGLNEKAKDEEKLRLLALCRNRFPEEILNWVDTCFVLTGEGRRFPPLLGTGGNEGSGSYVSGFAQQIVECLIDHSQDYSLEPSLFGTPTPGSTVNQMPGHFSPNAAGGPNAGQGFDGPLTTNAWDYLLCVEGSCVWASGAVRRMGQAGRSMAAFPFTVNVTGAGGSGIAFNDQFKPKQAKREVSEMWLPLWSRPIGLVEVHLLISEGRASRGDRDAETGADFVRAVASLGVDRGIDAFQRVAFMMRNGQSFLGISLGRFDVSARAEIDLLREIDPWLAAFRRAAGDQKAPPRLRSALNRIDSAVFEFCKYGGPPYFQQIVIALGSAERELALTEGKVSNSKSRPNPLVGLSPTWIEACNDYSSEFQVALALASIYDPERKIGPLRSNLEPVSVGRKATGEWYAKWAEKERAVVWNSAQLSTNLARALQRRIMDGERAGCARLPLASRFRAPLQTVFAFLARELNDERIEQLIWGLMMIDSRGARAVERQSSDDVPVPRAYALLKLLFLPRPLIVEAGTDGVFLTRLLRHDESGGVVIRPEPVILHLLNGGRIGEACAIAMRRLRASGLTPMPTPIRGGRIRDADWRELNNVTEGGINSLRIAAALLIPIDDSSVSRLVRLVIRGGQIEAV